MKTAIVYRSFFGTARKYAEWLHEEIESDIYKARQAGEKELEGYDLVVLCSGTYIGWISIRGYLKKRWRVLQNKKVVLLAVGLAPAEDEQSVRSFGKIPEHIRDNIKYFKVPGKIFSQNRDQVKKENLQPVLDYVRSLAA